MAFLFSPSLLRTKKIRLPDRHTLIPQDAVRSRDMEVKVRQRKLSKVINALELDHTPSQGQLCRLVLRTLKILRLELLQELKRLLDAAVQLVERAFGIGVRGILDSGNVSPGGETLGRVAGDLDLEGKGLHIMVETLLEERFGVDALRLSPVFGLVEDGGELLEAADEDGDGDFVEGDRHLGV